jgi:holo-[acyl-carrier protein] synthase
MIIGSGIDLVQIDRIQNIITKWNLHFLNKVYTSNEIIYCEHKNNYRFQSYAGYFAAKEALTKAIGTGMQSIKWKEIEIRKDALGKPFIYLSGQAKTIAVKRMISNINLSISHTGKLAIAQVIIEG